VDGAVVQARSEASGATRTVITDEDGQYRIDSLSPGTWTVVARLADGAASESRVVRLRLQQTVRVDFTVGAGLTEHVEVKAEAPLVDAKETASALRVNEEQVASLPLSGRVFTDLALLDSSVQPAAPGTFIGERGSVFTVNGQSGRSNSFLVDGLDNNDMTSGTSLNAFYSQQVIEEFVLLTNQYAPEFGHASGGVLNIVTKRGTNEQGWEAFLQGSAAKWNSPGDFVSSLPDRGSPDDTSNRLHTGFNFSGPFKQDRAFYFLAYEHMDFDDLIAYTGLIREDFESGSTEGGGRFIAPATDDNLFLRTDFNIGTAHTLMVRLSADKRETAGVNVGGVYTPESGFVIDEEDVSLAATFTSVVSSNVINEVRVLGARSSFDQFANSERPGVNRPSGVFGGNVLNLQNRDEDRFQFVENVTWRTGDHTLKFGLDVTRSRTRIQTGFNPNGNFQYNGDASLEPGDCGDLDALDVAEADDVTAINCPGVIGVDDDSDGVIDEPGNIRSYPLIYTFVFGQPESTLDDTRVSLFAQDRWQASSKLLFDYGLRYDVSTYRLPADAAVESVIPNGGAGRDTDNLAPRLGFTYTPYPDGRLVVRGGGGVFYDKLVLGFPAVSAVTSQTEIGLFFPQGLTWELDEDFVEETGMETLTPVLEFFRDRYSDKIMRFSTAPELETPYTVQFNVGLDMALSEHSALGINLTRAQGYHLPLMLDLNPVDGLTNPGVACTAENIDPSIEPYEGLPCHLSDPSTGSIASITTAGRSWYSGLDLNWRWQRNGSWVSASYTLSKAEDMGFDPLKGGISLPPDSRDLSGERGRSDGDRRHRLVLSGDSALPWLGLRLSGVWQLSSGLPYNVITGIDDNVDGILTDRPEGVNRNTGADTPLGPINAVRAEHNAYLPDDQQLEPVYSLEEPLFSQVDLRLYRRFPFGERGTGEVYFQVFNLLDRQNAGLIEGRVVSQNFGEPITLAGPPRTIEMGLRFTY
jgi:hypothetical protein